MITIRDKAIITKDQHVITIDVGDDVPEGEYEVDLILNAKKTSRKKVFTSRKSYLPVDPNQSFSRDEIYDDDGR